MNKFFNNKQEDDNPIEEKIIEQKRFVDDEEEEFIQPIFKIDKIFNNDYNTGNMDFEEYSNLPRVESSYAEQNLSDCYDFYEYMRKRQLEILIDKYFKDSEFNKTLQNKKKIPKYIIPFLFVSIKNKFETDEFSCSEIFTSIADYFGLNYEFLYENIPFIYREQLVRELDEKYGILKKRGIKRLF